MSRDIGIGRVTAEVASGQIVGVEVTAGRLTVRDADFRRPAVLRVKICADFVTASSSDASVSEPTPFAQSRTRCWPADQMQRLSRGVGVNEIRPTRIVLSRDVRRRGRWPIRGRATVASKGGGIRGVDDSGQGTLLRPRRSQAWTSAVSAGADSADGAWLTTKSR
jgi:hypothetical protein